MKKPLLIALWKLATIVVPLLIGAVLGSIATAAWGPRTPADALLAGPSIRHITELADLLTLRLDVADVLVSRIDGLTGGVQVAVLVKGDVNLGVDVSEARFERVDQARRTAVLVLPAPSASSARVDHDRTRLFALSTDGLWTITPGTSDYTAVVNRAMIQAQDLVVSAAQNNDADERARRHAEILLGAFFHSIGWQVQVRWSDRPEEPSNAAH
jgi:Protein of unknown function (DUF4230)